MIGEAITEKMYIYNFKGRLLNEYVEYFYFFMS